VFLISSPQNGGNGKIKGYEVGGQTFFDFLPAPLDGLGVQANYTFVDSRAPSPIPGQTVPLENLSRNSYNLVGIYEKGPFSLRAAYNWRDKYVTATTGDAAARPVIVRAQGQLDASISLDVTEQISLTVDATNLTKNKLVDYYGSPIFPKSFSQFDQTFEAGVRFRF
jgi:TonB-dependent receptor